MFLKPALSSLSQGGGDQFHAVHHPPAAGKAADALRLTNRPLHQIALEQGFASTRMMSDRFRRVHNMSPGEFRKARRQHPEAARIRTDRREQRYPVAVDKLFSLLNEPVARGWGASPLIVHPQQEQRLDLEQLNPLSASLRRMRVVITLRELDDLLREDVRQNLEAINEAIPIEGIDIAEPFLSSRLFATGWDDPRWRATPAGTICISSSPAGKSSGRCYCTPA